MGMKKGIKKRKVVPSSRKIGHPYRHHMVDRKDTVQGNKPEEGSLLTIPSGGKAPRKIIRSKREAVELARSYFAKWKQYLQIPAGRTFGGLGFAQDTILASPMLIHFQRALELCKQLKADPKIWIDAQFNLTKAWHKKAYPLPNQLYSTLAQLKYFSYVQERKIMIDVEKSVASMCFDDSARYDMYLKQYCDTYSMGEKETLLLFARDFPSWYHEKKGTLELVAHLLN